MVLPDAPGGKVPSNMSSSSIIPHRGSQQRMTVLGKLERWDRGGPCSPARGWVRELALNPKAVTRSTLFLRRLHVQVRVTVSE